MEKGRVSEFSSRALAICIAQQESPYVGRIRQSGLNFLGSTATPEFSSSILTESLQNGTTYNPWDLRYSPGGSSGGAGAVVAAGILPMSAASDAGGSIRLPASICGNVGIKYTREEANAIMEARNPLSLSSMGVNTRSIRDQAAFLDAALNPQRDNASPGFEGSFLASIESVGRPLMIAMSSTRWGDYRATDDAIAEMHRVAGVLRELGHSVEEVDADIDFRDLYKAFIIYWTAPNTSRVSPD